MLTGLARFEHTTTLRTSLYEIVSLHEHKLLRPVNNRLRVALRMEYPLDLVNWTKSAKEPYRRHSCQLRALEARAPSEELTSIPVTEDDRLAGSGDPPDGPQALYQRYRGLLKDADLPRWQLQKHCTALGKLQQVARESKFITAALTPFDQAIEALERLFSFCSITDEGLAELMLTMNMQEFDLVKPLRLNYRWNIVFRGDLLHWDTQRKTDHMWAKVHVILLDHCLLVLQGPKQETGKLFESLRTEVRFLLFKHEACNAGLTLCSQLQYLKDACGLVLVGIRRTTSQCWKVIAKFITKLTLST